MKGIILFMTILVTQQFSYSQIENVWIGGHPARPNDWSCAANWSRNKVPNEFSNVIINANEMKSISFPKIEDEKVLIRTLRINKGAQLKISYKSTLEILYQTDQINYNLIKNEGKLIIRNSKNYQSSPLYALNINKHLIPEE
jgi:hypothetical protein